VRLVRFPESTRRPCDPEFAPEGSHTGFADGFPLLVTSEGSLDELNAALLERGADPVPMSRFRPNIVLAGLPTRAEDHARRLRFAGGLELLLVKPCDRCACHHRRSAHGERIGSSYATLKRIRRTRAGGVPRTAGGVRQNAWRRCGGEGRQGDGGGGVRMLYD
jgi:uncharacterized protein YcbX